VLSVPGARSKSAKAQPRNGTDKSTTSDAATDKEK
jgi:hypothetical protein